MNRPYVQMSNIQTDIKHSRLVKGRMEQFVRQLTFVKPIVM